MGKNMDFNYDLKGHMFDEWTVPLRTFCPDLLNPNHVSVFQSELGSEIQNSKTFYFIYAIYNYIYYILT